VYPSWTCQLGLHLTVYGDFATNCVSPHCELRPHGAGPTMPLSALSQTGGSGGIWRSGTLIRAPALFSRIASVCDVPAAFMFQAKTCAAQSSVFVLFASQFVVLRYQHCRQAAVHPPHTFTLPTVP
jgi:hypothetical protein